MSIGKKLPEGRRTWVISSIEARLKQLKLIHDFIANHFENGDMLVYTGNIFGGVRGNITETIYEILDFRKKIMASFETEDICYIRGAYEDMLFKLFSLNFTNRPTEKFHHMMESGLKGMLVSYGVNPDEGKIAAEQGSVSILRFVENLKDKIKEHDGHYELLFSKSLVNYAFTEDKSLLILSAGFDKDKTLEEQKEEIAYGLSLPFKQNFSYGGFKNIIRGKSFEIADDGIFFDPYYITLNPVNSLYATLFNKHGLPEYAVKI